MTNAAPFPPPAEELVLLDRELTRLDARRGQLLARRAWLLAVLQPPAARPPRAWAGSGQVRPAEWPPRAGAGPVRAAETSAPSAQNVLLALGGLLLTVAAVAFTLVGWGHMGIGGRSAVLAAVTAAALAVPLALLRRGLVATAESVAALGLALLMLDAFALHRVALPDTDAVAYTAGAAAVLAALWAVYGRLARTLRSPLPAAVVIAQLPLLLWSLTPGSALTPAWALLGTAVLDAAVAVRARGAGVRVTAAALASVTGGAALLLGGVRSLAADSPAGSAGPAALLTAAAAAALLTALSTARRSSAVAAALSAVGGLALLAGAGGTVRTALPDDWAAPGYLLCATALLGAVALSGIRGRVPRALSGGLAAASAAVHALALVSALPLLTLALTGPELLLPDAWSGASPDARDVLEGARAATVWSTAVVLALLTAVAAAASRPRPAALLHGWTTGGSPRAPHGPHGGGTGSTARDDAPRTAGGSGVPDGVRQRPDAAASTSHSPDAPDAADAAGVRRWRHGAASAAGALGWAALFLAPAAVGAGFAAAVAFQTLLTAAALAIAVRTTVIPAAVTALSCGLAGGASVAAFSLAARPATFAVLGALLALAAAASAVSRAPGALRAVLGCTAAVLASALLLAVGAAADLTPGATALLLLAVPAGTALLSARLGGGHPVGTPVECAGAAAGAAAVLLALGSAPMLALVLGLGGVIAAGTALRADRRRAAAPVAAVLWVLAAWARLYAWEVTAPEAYTLPVSIPALAVGLLRRRRDPSASSWTAYGPGLAVTLVPSLAVSWGDAHWARPLLLGLAALAVTLAGARLRLRAPLLIGGAVLALVALHELAPYVVQVVDALPRWLPPALAGLLLLAVGATYEQRLREARRVRESLGRMR
ncbi:SCO7613 C-terminal domain-containing membrane protein [Streptomyces sp. NPDC014894]|uniref:SCO7613 C-terminal domain-containing membrane protein n=1 Tax=Streptomyces sp. NPDC014894 TaxID=3364931 RepID=UPI003701ACD1